MSLPATDTFTVASDTDLASYSNWVVNNGTFTVKAADYVIVASSSENRAHWSSDSFNDDQYSKGVIVGTGSSWIGVSVRVAASAVTDYSWYVADADTNYLSKQVAGTYTEIASDGTGVDAGDVIQLSITGTTLSPKKNSSSTGTPGDHTDSSISSGYAGICGYGTGGIGLDNWEGGNIGAAATIEQEGFRFGVDDANEASHTWAQNQDTNDTITLDTARLVRFIVNAAGDPAAITPKLKYLKNGTGSYATIPIGATTAGTPTSTGDVIAGTGTSQDRSGATAWTNPSYITADDTNYATATVPTDYLIASNFNFSAIPDGSTINGITVKVNASESGTGSSNYVPQLINGAATPTLIGSAKGAVTVNGTTKVTSSNGGSADVWGATLTAAIVKSSDFGVAIWSTDTVNTLSIDWISIDVNYTPPDTDNEIYIAVSANIAAGGEDTTARLTAPSGKSTSDFVTGRRWDNENGTDSLDLTTDDYSEVEWCIKLQSPAVGSDYYDLRVYNNDTALDTYTTTPRVTVSGSASLTATNITTGAPVFGTPAVGQKHALTSTTITTGSPVLGAPVISQIVALTSTNITTGAPTVAAPTIGQKHALVSTAITTGRPALGNPSIGQKHALTANGITTSNPVLGAPSISQNHVLTSTSIVTGNPVLDAPTAKQAHALVANGIITSQPTLGTPSIRQKHALTSTNITTGAPTLGAPSTQTEQALTATNITTGEPTLGAPVIGQVQVLTANGITTGTPSLGAPSIKQIHALTAGAITTNSPVLGTPSIGQVHVLQALAILTAAVTLGEPVLGQKHALTANGITMGVPVLDAPDSISSYAATAADMIFSQRISTTYAAEIFTLKAAARSDITAAEIKTIRSQKTKTILAGD